MMLKNIILYYLMVLVSCLSILPKLHASVVDFESTLQPVKSRTSASEQENAVNELIHRIIPDKAHYFKIKVEPSLLNQSRDVFVVKKNEEDVQVYITASSGVAAAWGLNHYLKYYCNCQISWEHHQQLQFPESLPNVNIKIFSQDRFRYYQNVCTLGYSFAWWKWPQWERHLDWMALNGINLPLAFVGQEAIWERVYKSLGLNQTEIDAQFTGPAFFAWGRMGNIRGWGGPLPLSWHSQTLQLQHKILDRMRAFGMTPVLPAFAGHVPQAITRIFPNANYTKMGTWNHFEEKYCCPFVLDPEDPAFKKIGSMFMKEIISEFGTNHIYNCDTFNEMSPRSGKESYLADVGRAIFSAITSVDESAVWLMQGWLFLSKFWTPSRAKALLTSVPQGRMLVLDLQTEFRPQYKKFDFYYGQPFIWCMLHNFGGTLGLYGAAKSVNQGVSSCRKMINSTMVGTGLTPEGINQNYVIYDLMLETAWREEPVNLTQWFDDYSVRRYGVANSNTSNAWQLLQRSVYSSNVKMDTHLMALFAKRPSFRVEENIWYNTSDVIVAWDLLMMASHQIPKSGTLNHDLVDVGRQSLQLLAAHFYNKLMTAYRKADKPEFREYSILLPRLLGDMDVLLGSNPDFLLGSWIKDARSWGTTEQESDLYEWNARNQITLWGPKGEILDYATKQWAGVVSHYYKPRWELFIHKLNVSLEEGLEFNQLKFNQMVFDQVEKPFTMDRSVFSAEPEGDHITAKDIYKRWRPHFKRSVAKAFKRQWKGTRKNKKLRDELLESIGSSAMSY